MHDVRLKEFMREFVISDSQLQQVYKRFGAEIRKGLARQTHAQADTKCYVTYVQDLPTGEETGQYLALDLGGTNFRVLLVTLQGHHEASVESHIYAVPREIMLGAGTELFDHIAACLATFVQEQQCAGGGVVGGADLPLGFTFSFPCLQLGLTRAQLVRWTKGFQCAGVEQEDVGRLLKEAIARRGDLQIDVMAILNDTTGTLMSCAHRNPDCKIGVIIGTGCNACYVEKVEEVELLETVFKEEKSHVVINTEWGAFGDGGLLEFIRTNYDRQVDKMSLNKGTQLFEKMISGMYLGELVRLTLVGAIEENLIFIRCTQRAAIAEIVANQVGCFETRLISEIEADSFPEFSNTRKALKELFGIAKASVEDCQKLKFICECISKRAAALVGIALSSLINKINEPKVVVGVDGSVYRFHPKFDAYMRETLCKFVDPKVNFDIMLSEDGSGRGAALVAAVAAASREE